MKHMCAITLKFGRGEDDLELGENGEGMKRHKLRLQLLLCMHNAHFTNLSKVAECEMRNTSILIRYTIV